MTDQPSKINQLHHLFLDQFLIRLPFELLRKNFRFAHFTIEKDSSSVKNLLKDTATKSVNGSASPDDVLKNLDIMLARLRGTKRKLSFQTEEEKNVYHQLDARIAHLHELTEMHTYEDVKYEAWSRLRLDRLVVDYLLRHGYSASATALADERQMRDLVDIDTFVAMSRIRRSLENGSVAEALAWCNDNKKELRKMESKLEFMLRCQQYIEMLRTGSEAKAKEAIPHAKKFIAPQSKLYPDEVNHIAGLLAYRPDTQIEAYAKLYSPQRWKELADLFESTHNQLLGLPRFPLLHTALSSGLAALKTPACHASQATSSSQPGHNKSMTASVCPICSTELNELARNVPYAHHPTSHVEHDLMLLPNGRVYGKARLEEHASKAGLQSCGVRDLSTGEQYLWDQLKKVFIT